MGDQHPDSIARGAGRRVLIVSNPAAGRSWRSDPAPKVRSRLTDQGFLAELRTIRDLHPADFSAADRVVVIGGDGTLHHLLPELMSRNLPVGLIPWGTGNVLARELGLSRDPELAARVASGGHSLLLELGLANQTPFLLMAGVGFDGYLVPRVRPSLKRLLGIASFWITGLSVFWRYPIPVFRVRLGGEVLEATQAIISNCRSYGGGLRLTPQADITRPGFDVCVFQGRTHFRYLSYLLTAFRGTHLDLPDVAYRKAVEVTVEGDRSLPFQLDGEAAGHLPVRFAPADSRLRVAAPPTPYR